MKRILIMTIAIFCLLPNFTLAEEPTIAELNQKILKLEYEIAKLRARQLNHYSYPPRIGHTHYTYKHYSRTTSRSPRFGIIDMERRFLGRTSIHAGSWRGL